MKTTAAETTINNRPYSIPNDTIVSQNNNPMVFKTHSDNQTLDDIK